MTSNGDGTAAGATVMPAAPGTGKGPTPEQLLAFHETMLTSRYVDDEEIRLKKQNLVFFQISGAGHEAVGVAAGHCLRAGYDWFYPYYRDRALMLQLGMSAEEMLMNSVGAADDPNSRSRQMPSHWGYVPANVPSSSSPTGTQFNQGVGCAEAGRYIIRQGLDLPAKADEITLITTGDGTTAQGEFFEALNYACLKKLRCLFLVEDNEYAISVPVEAAIAGGSVSRLVRGFPNLTIYEVDGTDLLECLRVFGEAVAALRSGLAHVVLIHAKVTRPYSHSLSDDHVLYRTKAELAEEAERDCIRRFETHLLAEGIVTEEDLEAIRQRVRRQVAEASERAQAARKPSPGEAMDHLYSGQDLGPEPEPATDGEAIPMGVAINRAMMTEMGRDKRILIFGEDVADASREEVLAECKGKGGVFKITYGLQQKYGADRVFNAPLAEAGIVGRAVGLATRGLKPIAEIQFFDYIWPAMEQIRNELATMRYRSGGLWSCPAVIRVPIGGYLRGGAIYHSQTGEAIFAKCPGLYIAYPSNALDALGLLRAALRMEDPVLFLEHKHLYYQGYNRAPDPGPDYIVPFGKARIRRRGEDLTLVTWGATVQRALDAADRVTRETGRTVEIIDLRTIVPLDRETILESVRRTNRCLVVSEESTFAGFANEVVALVNEECFEWLDAPVQRLGSLHTWVAYSPILEEAILPQTADIEQAVRRILAY